ncbi:unnamed protein product, partial [Heterosigma akashiwo]
PATPCALRRWRAAASTPRRAHLQRDGDHQALPELGLAAGRGGHLDVQLVGRGLQRQRLREEVGAPGRERPPGRVLVALVGDKVRQRHLAHSRRGPQQVLHLHIHADARLGVGHGRGRQLQHQGGVRQRGGGPEGAVDLHRGADARSVLQGDKVAHYSAGLLALQLQAGLKGHQPRQELGVRNVVVCGGGQVFQMRNSELLQVSIVLESSEQCLEHVQHPPGIADSRHPFYIIGIQAVVGQVSQGSLDCTKI